jgi:hypothetical protein
MEIDAVDRNEAAEPLDEMHQFYVAASHAIAPVSMLVVTE